MTSLTEAPAPEKKSRKKKSFKKRLKSVQVALNALFKKKTEATIVHKYVLIPPSAWKMVNDCKLVMEKLKLKGKVANYQYDGKKAFLVSSLVNVASKTIIVAKEKWTLQKIECKATLYMSNLPFLFSVEMAVEFGNFIGVIDKVNIPEDSSCHIGMGNIVFTNINDKNVINLTNINIAGSKIFLKWSKETLSNFENFIIIPEKKTSEKNSKTAPKVKTGSTKNDGKKIPVEEKKEIPEDNSTVVKLGQVEKNLPTQTNNSISNEQHVDLEFEENFIPPGNPSSDLGINLPETDGTGDCDMQESDSDKTDLEFALHPEVSAVMLENNVDFVPLPDVDACKVPTPVNVDSLPNIVDILPKIIPCLVPVLNDPAKDIVSKNQNTIINYFTDKQGSERLRGLANILKNNDQDLTPQKTNITSKRKSRPSGSSKSPTDQKKVKFNDSSTSSEDDSFVTNEIEEFSSSEDEEQQ